MTLKSYPNTEGVIVDVARKEIQQIFIVLAETKGIKCIVCSAELQLKAHYGFLVYIVNSV